MTSEMVPSAHRKLGIWNSASVSSIAIISLREHNVMLPIQYHDKQVFDSCRFLCLSDVHLQHVTVPR